MAKFLFVYRRGSTAVDNMTPEQMQQQMQRWQTWIAEGMQKGWLLEPGDALLAEGRVVKPKDVVTDGPFVESKEIVGGFSIVQAETIDAAARHAEGCPILLVAEGSVEVRPLAGFDTRK